ncbi:hypothetical protein AB4Y45_34545 [Paraburkholderia sp. EG287A]|uniref:hypothetical protein n=1 Tax=Paraburkholderia sp. EG287A TaxID=3237012 RepID=UPI0034D1BEEA
MTDESTLYVARHKTTGLYTRHIHRWFWGNREWMKSAKPSVADVILELGFAEERSPRWTPDLNVADVWADYDIEHYSQYLPDVEFLKIRLTGESLGPDTPWQRTVVSLDSEKQA